MRRFKTFAFAAVAGAALTIGTVPKAAAQISVSIGAAPVCPYGYFDYAPYSCAPYGYYGPQWFDGGAFIGVGPWFHGPAEFHGQVDNRYDPHYGYKGKMPKVGEHYAPPEKAPAFHGNEERDGRGHVTGDKGEKH
jgi:hypothetical protein